MVARKRILWSKTPRRLIKNWEDKTINYLTEEKSREKTNYTSNSRGGKRHRRGSKKTEQRDFIDRRSS